MLPFIDDPDMDGQLQRTLAAAYSGPADIGEALAAAGRITPGDYDCWWAEWSALGELSNTTAVAAEAAGHRVTACRARLRATEYWRQAWFFLRHDLDDERLQTGWRRHRASFRAAAALLPYEAEPVTVPFEGARMKGWFVRPDASGAPRPTIIAPCGYDSTAEAGWAATGYMALARGYNLYVVEGPGQGGMLYEQRVAMRPDFEVPFAVMLDDLLARPGVDPGAVVLMGRSFAGYLAPRAAAFDRRIAALVCDPGQVEFASRIVKWTGVPVAQMGAETGPHVVDADPDVAETFRGLLDGPRNTEYWGARMATHQMTDVAAFFRDLARYDITEVAGNIRCPTLITDGEGDFASQGEQLRGLLTGPTDFVHFPAGSGAGGHCEGLGATLFEQVAFDWIDTVIAAD